MGRAKGTLLKHLGDFARERRGEGGWRAVVESLCEYEATW
jgi:hypothetical protein